VSQTEVGAGCRPQPTGDAEPRRALGPATVPHPRAAPRPAPPAEAPRRRRGLPRGPLVEVAIVLAGIVAYFGARGLTESDPDVAVAHALDVVGFERALGLYREPQLQQAVLGHEVLIDALNWVYIWGHWPVIALVLVWTLRQHPRAYVVLRNALVISGAIGVVVFVLYPVAPPRLAGLGLMDSVTERSHAYRVLQPPAFVNQYAAIPSLHVGWDLLMGITIIRYARHPLVRLIGVLLPLAMVAAVVLTANHYLVDGVAGVVVALTGLALAQRLAARRTPRLHVMVPAPRAPRGL
jgi:membrane-associated phospholipid phosphatase